MARILVPSSLPSAALELLAGHEVILRVSEEPLSPAELAGHGPGIEGLVCALVDPIDATMLRAAPDLAVVATVSVGYDHIDLVAAAKAGVVVCNTPGVLDETTADLAFALILMASRTLSSAEGELRQGGWTRWRSEGFLGRDIHGATLGLVGYGRIARAVRRRAEGFAMRVLHHARHPTGVEGFVADLDELMASADVVSIHVPLSESTRHLIDRRLLGLMKPTAILVNTARGQIVDEEALAEALHSGRIFAAGLDVYEHEPEVHPLLLGAPRTTLLPHVGSATVETRTAMAVLASSAVAEVLSGGRPPNVVGESALNGGRPPNVVGGTAIPGEPTIES